MHPQMVIDEGELMTNVLAPDRFTPIIVTAQAKLTLLMQTIFSLLLRTEPFDRLAKLIVFINGPHRHSKESRLQDVKQSFLEELGMTTWTMPTGSVRSINVVIFRLWGQTGHSQLIDGAVPWVESRYYALVHDDIVVLDPSWSQRALEHFTRPDVALVSAPPLLLCGAGVPSSAYGTWQGPCCRLPHLNTAFTVCDRARIAQLNARWQSFHVFTKGRMKEYVGNTAEWTAYYRNHGGVDNDGTNDETLIEAVGYDVGAWVYYHMCTAGLQCAEFSPSTIHHVGSASWFRAPIVDEHIRQHRQIYDPLHAQLGGCKELNDLYNRYAAKETAL
jgi:hypothetical protein